MGSRQAVKAADFDSAIRGFESFLPSHSYITAMNTAMTNHQPLERLMVFTGNANPRFAQEVAKA